MLPGGEIDPPALALASEEVGRSERVRLRVEHRRLPPLDDGDRSYGVAARHEIEVDRRRAPPGEERAALGGEDSDGEIEAAVLEPIEVAIVGLPNAAPRRVG